MVKNHRKPSRKPWFITICSLFIIACLIAMPLLVGDPNGDKAPDWVRFLGHFHPVLLHLPIGVFALILFQETVGMFRSWRYGPGTPLFPMFFAAATAVVAVVAGFLLYQGGGYEGNATATRHLWLGLAFSVAAILTFLVKAWTVAYSGNALAFRAMLFGSSGLMAFASHDGASMTHGSTYLTQYAPPFLKKLLGEEVPAAKSTPAAKVASVDDLVVYTDVIAPILDNKCVQCHKAEKSKGRLRLDTYDMILKGGKEGDGIEPGNAHDSNLVFRIELEKDDDEHMPPEGKPDISVDELAVLKWWIDSGADPAKKVKDLEVPDAVRKSLDEVAGSLIKATAAAPINEELKQKVAGISKELSGALTYEAADSSNLVFTAVSIRDGFDDAQFGKLSPVLPELTSLDLASTQITDQSVEKLGDAKNLRTLRLSQTQIGDASLDTLAGLQTLESVNLYGTEVTDAGVEKLKSLPNLKHLYLWHTKVTPETIERLKKEMPNCEIVTGI
ncbi:hypothetical protein JIN85_13085 [Luteolibacter pohnpeiensis]|uniref:Cytochrome C Planctomycete-type domain-containing protein n=1 Tax=Luteolibacter pohnpeiensis TaxID=454153 RepID=A0A934VWJ8_9BACT|nr:c-type cytochrome domain-containing protein [Luteolibacter pohnpeiensis]MBK1883355.1 hypothetical protein [Luteolibacter pohnpeiensis]